MKISEAKLYFNQNQTPASADFDDVYFSNQDGIKETDYVFLSGNQLFERWKSHQNRTFHIAETGFGTGLNFFRTMQLFALFRAKYPFHQLQTLHFTSTEKYPLAKTDAEKIVHTWITKQVFAATFCDSLFPDQELNRNIEVSTEQLEQALQVWLSNYPLAIKGIHRRHFRFENAMALSEKNSAKVTLDLHYGDALESFSNLRIAQNARVDAWFLDGFAPSKNEGLWQNDLFKQMFLLSNINATLATFTAAGKVKRGLIAEGFSIQKRKGFGKKREMLIGVREISKEMAISSDALYQQVNQHAPYFARDGLEYLSNTEENKGSTSKIAIVGCGLAGAIMAQKLCAKGIEVELIWQGDSPADGASGNPIGGFYPQLNAQHNTASQVQLFSFLYAKTYYQALSEHERFDHHWCGALQLAFNTNTDERLQKLGNNHLWPNDVARLVDQVEASQIANIDIACPSLYLPMAGWISPPSLTEACIRDAQQTGLLTVVTNTKLLSYRSENNRVVATFQHQQNEYDTNYHSLVLALGNGMQSFTKETIPLRLTRGQVEMVKTQAQISSLNTLICHKGYFTPAVNSFHALGSTYIKNDTQTHIRSEETDINFSTHLNSIGEVNWREALANSQLNKANHARAAIRCSTPDHLPIVGQMPSKMQFEELSDLYKALPVHHYPQGTNETNVFILSGLGSRGLTTAPLMAEILVSQMLHEPLPVNQSLADSLQPNRFIVRSLIRRQALFS